MEIFVNTCTAFVSFLFLLVLFCFAFFLGLSKLNHIFFRYVNGVVYFGLALSSGEFGGSIYFNFVITSLVEIPANALFIHNCNR